MKRFSLGRRLVAAGFGVAMAAVAVPAMAIPAYDMPPTPSLNTVWYKTDNNVNTLGFSYLVSGSTDGIFSYGIFAPTNTSLDPNLGYLAVSPSADRIDFTQSGSNWNLKDLAGNTFTLHGSDHFLLGATTSSSGPWVADTGYQTYVPGSSYLIYFPTGSGWPFTAAKLVGNDLAPVPIPAPVWLFASGLIGIVGVARRRRPTDGVR